MIRQVHCNRKDYHILLNKSSIFLVEVNAPIFTSPSLFVYMGAYSVYLDQMRFRDFRAEKPSRPQSKLSGSACHICLVFF
jgi:hypothetical protein